MLNQGAQDSSVGGADTINEIIDHRSVATGSGEGTENDVIDHRSVEPDNFKDSQRGSNEP
jgi:hypothetical protein